MPDTAPPPSRSSQAPTSSVPFSQCLSLGCLSLGCLSLGCRSLRCPPAQGLYDPAAEKDACGVAFLADLQGRRTNALVRNALVALHNMDHRGAAGAEASSGDGSGLTAGIPHELFAATVDFALPALGGYATGIAFLPADATARARVKAVLAEVAADDGLAVLGWRPVPIRPDDLGPTARSVIALLRTALRRDRVHRAGYRASDQAGIELERRAYGLRKVAERRVREAGDELYFRRCPRAPSSTRGC